ncbi:MAG TPA: signal peptidase II, partial [Woeseiaceae bacterium]
MGSGDSGGAGSLLTAFKSNKSPAGRAPAPVYSGAGAGRMTNTITEKQMTDSRSPDKTRTPDGRKPFITCIAVSALIVALDQLTKWAILTWVPLYDKIALNSFINIPHQQNRGAAFSFLADASGWQRWFFTA